MSRYIPNLRSDARSVTRDRQSEVPTPVLITEKRSQATNVSETAKLLLAGGVAGALSKSATAPLARLTILYQVSQLLTPGDTRDHYFDSYSRAVTSAHSCSVFKQRVPSQLPSCRSRGCSSQQGYSRSSACSKLFSRSYAKRAYMPYGKAMVSPCYIACPTQQSTFGHMSSSHNSGSNASHQQRTIPKMLYCAAWLLAALLGCVPALWWASCQTQPVFLWLDHA